MLFPVTICDPESKSGLRGQIYKIKNRKLSFYPAILRIGCRRVYQYGYLDAYLITDLLRDLVGIPE